MSTEQGSGRGTSLGPERVVLLLFVVLAYFPLFLHLDALPIRLFDESRLATNTYEMWRSGDVLVTTYQGEPDLWNTKPPLLIWLQSLLFAVLGPGELAMRLPSAIAAFLTGWFLLRTMGRTLSAPWMGLIACLVLYTNEGYINMHVARSGDYDALLVLWMTLSAWSMYRWTVEGRPKDILWFFAFLALGALTKSIQALLFLPGLFLYLLIEGKALLLFRTKQTYIGAVLFVLFVAGFYAMRELSAPGYLEAVWMNEIGGRYGEALEGHRGPWYFYARLLIDHHFRGWWILVPVGMALGLAHREQAFRRWTTLLVCMGGAYLFVVSSAGTKLEWYAAPLFPILAALVAIALYIPFVWLRDQQVFTAQLRARVLPFLFLFVVFVGPYSETVGRVYFPEEWPWDQERYAAAHYLQKAYRSSQPTQVDAFSYDDYNAHHAFYVNLMRDRGDAIRMTSKVDLKVGQRVLALEPFVKDHITTHYDVEVIMEDGPLRVFLITGDHHDAP
jgi:4-amino-4-deoxy-L-arabinose transferase-like glycosyltransferase